MSSTNSSHERPELSFYSIEKIARSDYVEWIRQGILAGLIAYTAVAVGKFLTGGGYPVGEALVALVAAISLFLVHVGRVRLATQLVLFTIIAELHTSVGEAGSVVGDPGIVLFPVFVMTVGLLMGARAAYRVALCTSLSVPVAAVLGRGLVVTPGQWDPWADVYPAVVLAANMIAAAIIVGRGLDAFSRVIDRAHRDERRFAALFTNAPDGMVLFGSDRRVEAANPFAERIFGSPFDAIVGRSWSELPIATEDPIELPDLASKAEQSPLRLDVARPDGSVLSTEVTSQRVPLEQGQSGTLLVLRDISERKEMEARVAQLGDILRQATSEIYVVGADPLEFLVVSRGACENLGHSAAELEAMSVDSVIPDFVTGLTRRQSGDGEPAKWGGILTRMTVHRRKDGSAYPAEHRIQVGELGGRAIYVVFAIDVTGRERAREEKSLLHQRLQQAQKLDAVGLLAGGVAHDFNNLLTVIGGSAELITLTADGANKELANEILQAHDKGAVLTRRLLAFARQEVVQPIVLSLVESLEETRPLLETLLGERITLETRCEGAGTIVADPGQFEQVLLNLAANARDAMPDGGTVSIDADIGHTRDGFARVSVIDTGLGMDDDVQHRAFEPFFTTKGRDKGTGLGLSTVHGIMVQNDGSVEIESRLGEGTRISVYWPLSLDESIAPSESNQAPDTAPSAGTILVVEDNDGARRIVGIHLENARFYGRVRGVCPRCSRAPRRRTPARLDVDGRDHAGHERDRAGRTGRADAADPSRVAHVGVPGGPPAGRARDGWKARAHSKAVPWAGAGGPGTVRVGRRASRVAEPSPNL